MGKYSEVNGESNNFITDYFQLIPILFTPNFGGGWFVSVISYVLESYCIWRKEVGSAFMQPRAINVIRAEGSY